MFNGNNAGDCRPGDSEIMDDELHTNMNKIRIDSKNENGENEIKNDARVKVEKGKNALPILIPEEDFRFYIFYIV